MSEDKHTSGVKEVMELAESIGGYPNTCKDCPSFGDILSLLKEVETAGRWGRDSDPCCPICEGTERYDGEVRHLPDCALAKALKGVEG